MKNKSIFSLLFLFALIMGSCDTGEYYEVLEDDTIESYYNDSKQIDFSNKNENQLDSLFAASPELTKVK